MYCFGPYRLDPERRTLSRGDGSRVPLTPKVFEALLLLVESGGRLLQKEELLKALWPDTFVNDASLAQVIFVLRKALGDNASDQKYILTVPGRGYQFLETVTPQATSSGALVSAPSHANYASERNLTPSIARSLRWSAPALGVVILALAFLLYASAAPTRIPRVLRFAELPLSIHVEPQSGLVTDGVRLYYLERGGDRWQLMETAVAGGSPQPLSQPLPFTRILDVSRDGSRFLIGQAAEEGSEMPLWVWPLVGGKPLRISGIFAQAAAWFPDGHEIIYSRDDQIRAVRPDGTGDHLFVRTPGYAATFHWSPDGSVLSFTVGDPRSGAKSLWVASRDGSGMHLRFAPANGEQTCCGTWTADGKYFLYGVEQDGVYNLWAVREPSSVLDWSASHPVQLTSAASSVYGSLPIGNGHRVFSIVDEPLLETRKYSSDWQHSNVLVPNLHAHGIEFSPGGKWVAFLMSSDSSLWRSRPDGSDRMLLVPNFHAAHPAWSPDGSKLAFEGHPPGKPPRAYMVSAEGGAIEEVAPDLAGMESVPTWSPDGRSVAVALNVIAPQDSSLPRGIFLVDLGNHRATKLASSEGLSAPSWSPDGKSLIAKTYDEQKILRFDPAHSRWDEIVTGNQLSSVTWSRDSHLLYFQEVADPGAPLYRLDMKRLQREKVFSFEYVLKEGGISRCIFHGFAPDGSPMLQLTRGSSELYSLDLDLP